MKKATSYKKNAIDITIISLGLFIFILLLTLLVPYPTPFQGLVVRTLLSAATSGFVTSIPGLLSIKVGDWLRASGALAVFVLVFLFNPAQL